MVLLGGAPAQELAHQWPGPAAPWRRLQRMSSQHPGRQSALQMVDLTMKTLLEQGVAEHHSPLVVLGDKHQVLIGKLTAHEQSTGQVMAAGDVAAPVEASRAHVDHQRPMAFGGPLQQGLEISGGENGMAQGWCWRVASGGGRLCWRDVRHRSFGSTASSQRSQWSTAPNAAGPSQRRESAALKGDGISAESRGRDRSRADPARCRQNAR